MALILEVVQPDGVRARYALNGQTLTLGRALANDVVLDDPYVDASHARVTLDESGVVMVEDLGSVNGMLAGEQRLFGRAVVGPGDALRLGRTTLRIRDPNEAIPPALIDRPAPTSAPSEPRLVRRWLATVPGQLGVAVVALGAFVSSAWLQSSGRSSANFLVDGGLGYAMLLCIWAGLWSLASRIIVHRFCFLGHVAIASGTALGGLFWSHGQDWLHFFFPDVGFVEVPSFIVFAALLTALVAGHLGLTSTIPSRRRWKIALIAAASIMAISLLSALSKDDSFSDVPKYSATLKPIAASWVPTKTVSQFESVTRDLKNDVDGLAKK